MENENLVNIDELLQEINVPCDDLNSEYNLEFSKNEEKYSFPNDYFNVLSPIEIREELVKILEHYNSKEHLLYDIDYEIYRKILLNKEDNSFAIDFNLVKKLDLSNFSFDNVNIRFLNFKGSKGVKINPQKVYNKDLSYCILEGAEVEGSFDDALIYYTNFKGTNGIEINPQKVRGKNLAGAVLTDTTITGSFDGTYIRGTEFTGSKGAIIDIGKIYLNNIEHTVLDDAIVMNNKIKPNSFREYNNVDFEEQSVNAKIKKLTRK